MSPSRQLHLDDYEQNRHRFGVIVEYDVPSHVTHIGIINCGDSF